MANTATKTTVAPYDRVSDVDVVISVLHPQPVKGLGNLLILNAIPGKKAPAKNQGGNVSATLGNQTKPAVTDHPVKMTSLATDPATISGSVGDTIKVTIKDIKPDNVTNGNITVTSKDPSVVTVDPEPNSLIFDAHLVSAGDAEIEIKSNDGGVTKTMQVTAVPTQAPVLEAGSDELTTQDRMNGILLRKTDTKTGAVFREYKDVDAVASDYGEDSPVYSKAQTYFAQENHSDHISVLDYDPAKAYDALKAFWNFNWTFAVQSGFAIDDSAIALSNIFESNRDHFLVVQNTDLSKFKNFYGQSYVIALYHDTKENMDAALVGAVATLTIGSVTWKFKALNGITPQVLTSTELSGINRTHAIAYIEVNGVGETSEGWTMSGEYIDVIYGIMFVHTKMENDLEVFLQQNGKVPYEQNGILQIEGVATQVLEQAFQQGIILTDPITGKGDYHVYATGRDKQSRDDISARHYGGLSFVYHVSGAIHTITVHGEVDSDTILS